MRPATSDETLRVIAALDTQYPPTNPAVLLTAARDAYLTGRPASETIRLLTWTLYVMSNLTPRQVTTEQHEAISALYFAKDLT